MKYSQHQLNEIILRDWAVRVLDAWQLASKQMYASRARYVGTRRHARGFFCVLEDQERLNRFDADSLHAARLAAAEAVWPELPEAAREELGERP